jgi:hypothetical protein
VDQQRGFCTDPEDGPIGYAALGQGSGIGVHEVAFIDNQSYSYNMTGRCRNVRILS